MNRAIPFVLFCAFVIPAGAQKWKAPRTPDGQPDLQGVWTNATVTPLERPAELAGKEFFTEKEVAEFESTMRERNNMDKRLEDKDRDVARAYNDAWWDRGTRAVKTRRTSLIVEPADGKVPALTPQAQAKADARAAALAEKCKTSPCSAGNDGTPRAADGWEDRSLSERCILWATAGPPMLPSAYNNNYQIVQTRDTVAIVVEMIHDVRIIPLEGKDARPPLPPAVRPWMGDSRGHWEGDTLVVETTSLSPRTNFRGSAGSMKLTERFTRTDSDTLMYRFTVDDPDTFTKPWTAEIPMTASEGPLYEYACHEGNYGMTGLLAGARAIEKARAEGKK